MIELRESVEVLSKENDDLVERVMLQRVNERKLNIGKQRWRRERSLALLSLLPAQGGERVNIKKEQIGKSCGVVRVGQESHHHCQ